MTGYNATTNTIDTGTIKNGTNVGSTPFLVAQQQTSNNQGKPGFDVLGGSLSSNAQIADNQKRAAALGVSIPGVNGAQSTTTLSSDKSKDIVDIQNKTKDLSKTGVTTDPNTGVSTYADGTVYNPTTTTTPATSTTGVSTGGYVGDVYYPPGATLPVGTDGNYLGTTETSPTDDKILKNLTDLRTQNDALTASVISSVQKQYEQLIRQQEETNRGQTAGTTNLLLKGGGLEHTGSGQNVLSSTISYGISQLADLTNKEQMAIISAQQAGLNNDFQLQGKINDEISKIRDDKITAAKDLNEKLVTANKEIATKKQKVIDDINGIASDAKKNGASDDIVKAILATGSVSDALTAARNSLQTASGVLGDYLQYKRDTESKGLVPKDYEEYKTDQDAKDLKQKTAEAYATQAAKNSADANSTASDKVQQKLEQQYRQVLSKEFSARTGALGIENAKVNQANHLNSLFSQYYDPKTGKYNVPKSQYAELAMGLANLVSPSGTVTEGARDSIMQKTAAGDFMGAISYITGTPQKGTTDEVIKNIVDSVDRQAETAVRNRETALQNMRDQAPTDLDPDRIEKLNKSTKMVDYEGQDRISKKSVDDFLKTGGSQTIELADGPHSMYYVVAQLYDTPGATDKDVEDYLIANGFIQ